MTKQPIIPVLTAVAITAMTCVLLVNISETPKCTEYTKLYTGEVKCAIIEYEDDVFATSYAPEYKN